MKITAAVVPARSARFEIETLDLAAPLADEVLVRVVATGMCHTDLHARDGYFPNLPYPVVCGHEGAGIIEQVGAAVADLAPGDPVVISFPWCGDCGPCRATRISYCERARPLKSSGRRADGSIPMSRNGEPVYSCFFQQSSFASFAVAPAKDVVRVRRDAPIEVLGPLGCGLQTGAGAVLNVMRCTIPMRGRAGAGGIGRCSIFQRRCIAWRPALVAKAQGICPQARARGITISGFRNIAVRARQSATTRTITKSSYMQSKSLNCRWITPHRIPRSAPSCVPTHWPRLRSSDGTNGRSDGVYYVLCKAIPGTFRG